MKTNLSITNLSILGSTGSIGRNTLEIVGMYPQKFNVHALAAKTNVKLLASQIVRYQPKIAVVFDEKHANKLKLELPKKTNTEVLYGKEGYRQAATLSSVDTVLSAMVGAAGLMPTLAAIKAGKKIGLANKETLVVAGEIVIREAAKNNAKIIPVDSEHSAIFQCIIGNRVRDLKKIILTGSGGPFRNLKKKLFSEITVKEALNHPNWDMGPKITIDSATLMNKGLEVIEAKWLFNVSLDMIEVLIHPQSIIHSMVAYKDGSVIAQLGIPDMKGAISYALSQPERLDINNNIPDFVNIAKLTFHKPDYQKFPCLDLACRACDAGGTFPAVLNAANEIAVNAFLNNKIPFTHIPEIIKDLLDKHVCTYSPALSDVIEADLWARREAENLIIGD